MRDEQVSAVYKWEDQWKDWNRETASKAELRRVIRWAERKYRVRAVRTIWFPKRNRGASGKLPTQSDSLNRTIHIRPRHRNPAVALHEVAHAIHDHFFGLYETAQLQGHGPIWLGIYLWLLIEFKIAPRAAILGSAKAAGIKWAPLGKIAPNNIRRAYKGLRRKAKFT